MGQAKEMLERKMLERVCRTWVDDLVDGGRLGEGKFLFVGVGEDGPGGGTRECIGRPGRRWEVVQMLSSMRESRATMANFPSTVRWDAHLEVGSCDETCPDDGHDIPGSGLAVSYEFGAEP